MIPRPLLPQAAGSWGMVEIEEKGPRHLKEWMTGRKQGTDLRVVGHPTLGSTRVNRVDLRLKFPYFLLVVLLGLKISFPLPLNKRLPILN